MSQRTHAACGTHAAYQGHYRRGEKPCDACREAGRQYQRQRYNRKRPRKLCVECGVKLSKGRRTVCSTRCRSARLVKSEAYRRSRAKRSAGAYSRKSPRECEECGGEFLSERGRYCSLICYGDSIRGDGPESRSHIPNGVRRHVYERDAWRCQLCGKRVGRKLGPNHPRRPSLDHIVPISAGGEDVTENLQLAHLCCNVAKNAGVWGDGEQLRLVG